MAEKKVPEINVDEILRIGSVLERSFIEARRQEAFDWLAENRENIADDIKMFATYLNIAIGDLCLSGELIKKSLDVLITEGVLTRNIYEKHFKFYVSYSEKQQPTVLQLAKLLKDKSNIS